VTPTHDYRGIIHDLVMLNAQREALETG